MLLIYFFVGLCIIGRMTEAVDDKEELPKIDDSDIFAAELANAVDAENRPTPKVPENAEKNSFSFFPAFLRFSRLSKMEKGRPPVCFCCRTFVCHHQRCPCSKYIL
uniref:Uncharacterized protein n=1 Tax=Panagrolaimus sp. JU765 TaxID=591449 RepID=A0AC34QW31_9BILA